jgi:hypothetical protein
VIEEWRTSPQVIELVQRVQDTQIFLKMAVIELRRLAEQAPDMAGDLLQIMQKIEAEAEDLARDIGSGPASAIRAEL